MVLNWLRKKTGQLVSPSEHGQTMGIETYRFLQDVVDSIVEGLGYWAAMVAIVENVDGVDRLTVKAFATRLGSISNLIPGLTSDMIGKTLLQAGEAIADAKLIDNFVEINEETAQVNKAVYAIHRQRDYLVVDNLHQLFAPRLDEQKARLVQNLSRVKSMVTMPFRNSQGVVIGNLYAGTERDVMPQEMIRQLRAFTRMAIIALENSSLQSQSMRITSRETVLKDTIAKLLSGVLNEKQLLLDIVDAAVHTLGFNACLLALVRMRDGRPILTIVASRFANKMLEGLLAEAQRMVGKQLYGSFVPVDEATAAVNRSVRSILNKHEYERMDKLYDVFAPEISETEAQAIQVMFRIKTLATVPLRNKAGELIGSLIAGTGRPSIVDSEIEEMKTFALAASIALENAEHVREARRMGLMAAGVGHVVHRINNLLGGVGYDMEELVAQIKTKSDSAQNGQHTLATQLEQMRAGVTESLTLISSFRDHVRQPQIQDVDVNAQLQRAIKTLKDAQYGYVKPEGIQIKENFGNELIFVPATEDDLFEVFRILLKNACEAMGQQGEITIATNRTQSSTGNTAVITISDTGKGIPEAELNDLFRLKSSPKSGGLGYGLWSAKLTIDWFEGKISARRNESGPGTQFVIELPAV